MQGGTRLGLLQDCVRQLSAENQKTKSETNRVPPFQCQTYLCIAVYFVACVWKVLTVIALAWHWLASKPVWRGCSKQRHTAAAAKSERPLIVLPGGRECKILIEFGFPGPRKEKRVTVEARREAFQ